MADPKTVAVTPEIHEYLLAHGTPLDDVQRSLIEATGALGPVSGMQIAPEQGAFMTLLTQLVGARFAVEVGTFTGYSALCIARGLSAGRPAAVPRRERGVDEHRPPPLGRGRRRRSDRAADRPGRRRAAGRCPPTRRSTSPSSTPTRRGYRTYYDEIVDRLRPGGLVLLDNVLWGGAVVDAGEQRGRHRGHPGRQRPRGRRPPRRGRDAPDRRRPDPGPQTGLRRPPSVGWGTDHRPRGAPMTDPPPPRSTPRSSARPSAPRSSPAAPGPSSGARPSWPGCAA